MSDRFRRPRYKTDQYQRRSYDIEAATPEINRPRKRQKLTSLWLVPFFAALLGLYLAISFYNQKGPTIKIRFDSAEGLVAGKTPIRYRNVNIGIVDKITLSDDLETVMVEAGMSVDSRRYLNEHAKFWVVRPRVAASGVSGLSTLLSGSYIQVNSLVGENFQSDFIGKEQPPLTEEGAAGMRLRLRAEQAGYVGIGSPVYYRQVKVGQIEAQRFLPNYAGVEFTIFVDAPHHEILRNTTKFWNVSGVSVNLSANGLSLRTPSLEGLAQGGVAFDVIEEYAFPQKVVNGHVYTLHESFEAAQEDTLEGASTSKYEYVTFFDGSVRGLSRGAPVELQGVQIGRVTDIRVEFDQNTGAIKVPVYIEFQPERVRGVQLMNIDTVNEALGKSLRAKLQTGNLLTGQLYVSLEKSEDDAPQELARNADGVPILPSIKSDLEQVTDGVQQAIATINELPLEQLIADASSTVTEAKQLLADFNQLKFAAKLNGTVGTANVAIDEYAKLAKGMRGDISRLSKDLNTLVDTAGESIEGIAPDSPLYYNLLNTFKDVQQAARAVLAVSESVEKKPEEFLFGK